MELRKVQLTGGSSITVTLPKAWTDRRRVKPGDVIGFSEQPDGSLSLVPHAKAARTAKRFVVDLDEPGQAPAGERARHARVGDEPKEHVFRRIIAAYLMGHDVIVVSSKRPLPATARASVRDVVRRVIGLEIVDEEPNAITLQDFLDPREFHVDKALRRMSMLARAMQDEALGMIRAPSEAARESVAERDDEVDRLYWLVSKQYHAMLRDATYAAKMDLTTSEALNFLLVARIVERTADHADRIAAEALALPRAKISDAFLARLDKEGREAAVIFRDAMQTFLKPDARKANEVIDEASAFLRTHEKLLKDATALGGETVSHLAIIVESLGRTAAYAADVGEVAINHGVASASEATGRAPS